VCDGAAWRAATLAGSDLAAAVWNAPLDCPQGQAAAGLRAQGGQIVPQCAPLTGSTSTPRHCKEARQAGSTVSGLYTIDPDGTGSTYGSMVVQCDMVTDGGGWTHVITAGGEGVRVAGAVGARTDALFKHADTTINALFADASNREMMIDFAGAPMFLRLSEPFALAAQAPRWRYPSSATVFGPCTHSGQQAENHWFFIKTYCNPTQGTCGPCQSGNYENGMRTGGFYGNDGANVWRGSGWSSSFKLYVR
jgi:predicted aconitase with swiveling domain